MQQNQNFADRANRVLEIVGLGLWLPAFQVSYQFGEAKVQHVYFVDTNDLQEGEFRAHTSKHLRHGRNQVQYHCGAQIVDEYVVEVVI